MESARPTKTRRADPAPERAGRLVRVHDPAVDPGPDSDERRRADDRARLPRCPTPTSVKVGLQFKRRFWETDEQIYGGVTYTDLPIGQISYPSSGYFSDGKGVLLGAYIWDMLNSMEFTSMTPAERVAKAVEYGSHIHPQYREEFDNGVAVAWHRAPFAMGCFGLWTEATRAQHYDNLCGFDGRIVLAGEHASYLPAWQEGAVTSALDAIGRLHRRALAAGAST